MAPRAPSTRGRVVIAQPTHGRAMKGPTEYSAAPYDGRSPYVKNGLRDLSSQITSPLNGPVIFLKK